MLFEQHIAPEISEMTSYRVDHSLRKSESSGSSILDATAYPMNSRRNESTSSSTLRNEASSSRGHGYVSEPSPSSRRYDLPESSSFTHKDPTAPFSSPQPGLFYCMDAPSSSTLYEEGLEPHRGVRRNVRTGDVSSENLRVHPDRCFWEPSLQVPTFVPYKPQALSAGARIPRQVLELIVREYLNLSYGRSSELPPLFINLSLSLVSKDFRDVVRSIPWCWNRIYIGGQHSFVLRTRDRTYTELDVSLSDTLRYSHVLPLDIDIDISGERFTHIEPLLPKLVSQSHRWTSVKIRDPRKTPLTILSSSPAFLPNLRLLSLDLPRHKSSPAHISLFGGARSLEELRLVGIRAPTLIDLPWKELCLKRLSTNAPDFISHIMTPKSCQGIDNVYLIDADTDWSLDPDFTMRTITLSDQVKHFTAVGNKSWKMLRFVASTSLESLDVDYPTITNSSFYDRVLLSLKDHPSISQLTQLSLRVNIQESKPLEPKFFSSLRLPLLEKLTLDEVVYVPRQRHDQSLVPQLSLHSDKPRLPRLKHLVIKSRLLDRTRKSWWSFCIPSSRRDDEGQDAINALSSLQENISHVVTTRNPRHARHTRVPGVTKRLQTLEVRLKGYPDPRFFGFYDALGDLQAERSVKVTVYNNIRD